MGRGLKSSGSSTCAGGERRVWFDEGSITVTVTHSQHWCGEQTPGKELQEDHHHCMIHTGPADALLELKHTQTHTYTVWYLDKRPSLFRGQRAHWHRSTGLKWCCGLLSIFSLNDNDELLFSAHLQSNTAIKLKHKIRSSKQTLLHFKHACSWFKAAATEAIHPVTPLLIPFLPPAVVSAALANEGIYKTSHSSEPLNPQTYIKLR